MPVARLHDRTIIAVSGADAFSFLQNIVTADMHDVDRLGTGYGGLLTPQGKIICDFLIFPSDDGYNLDVRRDAADTLTGRLSLYRLRAKIDIARPSGLAVFAGWNEAGENPPDPRLAELGQRWIAPEESGKTLAAETEFHHHRIRLGVPEGGIDFAFGDAFPHDAAMDSLNGIAFEKGCYVGQEVVSRMRHRGTARRRIVQVKADAGLPQPGTEILAAGQPLGHLGSSSDIHGIALVRLDRVEKARAAANPVMAGAATLDVTLPDWAGYRWPSEAPAA